MKKYRQVDSYALRKRIDLSADALWLQLHGPGYSPNLDTHILGTDLTSELATGAGYTVGGVQLSGVTVSYITAANWAFPWVASAVHSVEDVVRPATSNGYLYRCAVAGTSSATAPTWPTAVGQTVQDGSVIWECVGSGATQVAANNASWGAPFTAGPIRYAVLLDKTPTTPILIGLADFGSSLTGQGGAFSEQFSAMGIFLLFEQ